MVRIQICYNRVTGFVCQVTANKIWLSHKTVQVCRWFTYRWQLRYQNKDCDCDLLYGCWRKTVKVFLNCRKKVCAKYENYPILKTVSDTFSKNTRGGIVNQPEIFDTFLKNARGDIVKQPEIFDTFLTYMSQEPIIFNCSDVCFCAIIISWWAISCTSLSWFQIGRAEAVEVLQCLLGNQRPTLSHPDGNL